MRYIDTSSRDPAHALGTWLQRIAERDIDGVRGLRWRSGFFSADALGFVLPLLFRLKERAELTHLLVGSNDGATTRADIETLILLSGAPRENLRIGVVNYENAYFHPKTIHVQLSDGASVAYVGSANLTASGAASLHVEAGILLDTRDGDDPRVLNEIAEAVDWWFRVRPAGLYPVATADDLDRLVADGVINVPRPVLAPRPHLPARRERSAVTLRPLLRRAPLPPGVDVPQPAVLVATPPGPPPITPTAAARRRQAARVARWEKRLTRSDAQRKSTGNQRGSITLVRARQSIDAQTYFRRDFFSSAAWTAGTTRTGATLEMAFIPFRVSVMGQDLGTLALEVTYAANREARQKNYTSLLHLGPLAQYFVRYDVTNRRLVLERATDGSYSLTIL